MHEACLDSACLGFKLYELLIFLIFNSVILEIKMFQMILEYAFSSFRTLQGEILITKCVHLRIKADFKFWLHEAWLVSACLGFELGARMTIVGCHNSI